MITKQRKVDSTCRVFYEKTERTIFFAEANIDTARCLIRNKSVLKEYDFLQHYDSKNLLKLAVSSACFFCVTETSLLKSFVLSSLLTRCLSNFFIFFQQTTEQV